MIKEVDFPIPELQSMKKYPEKLFYIGNLDLLQKRKISIVGTRHPLNYTKEFTHKLSSNVIYNNKLKSIIINLNTIFYSHKIIYLL